MDRITGHIDMSRLQIKKPSLKDAEDAIKCVVCSCQYLEEVRVARYYSVHAVVIGQAPPRLESEMQFVVLRCVRCGELYEPTISGGLHSPESERYGAFKRIMMEPVKKDILSEKV